VIGCDQIQPLEVIPLEHERLANSVFLGTRLFSA
jgi:hypothetical protein